MITTVYRIEDSAGMGIYNSNFLHTLEDSVAINSTLTLMSAISTVFTGFTYAYHYCAFASIRAMKYYVYGSFIHQVKSMFKILKLEVDVDYIDEDQAAFSKDKILKTEDITDNIVNLYRETF